MTKYALVYQCGLANVFKCEYSANGQGVRRKRMLQHAYAPCEYFAAGLAATGAEVMVFHAEYAGDAANTDWLEGKGTMFADRRNPPDVFMYARLGA